MCDLRRNRRHPVPVLEHRRRIAIGLERAAVPKTQLNGISIACVRSATADIAPEIEHRLNRSVSPNAAGIVGVVPAIGLPAALPLSSPQHFSREKIKTPDLDRRCVAVKTEVEPRLAPTVLQADVAIIAGQARLAPPERQSHETERALL